MLKGFFPALGLAIAVTLAGGSAFAGAGDPVKGEKVFKKCKACHSAKPGKNKVGPSLAGVFGRKAGTAGGYKKYRGLKGADYTWDEALLDEYLANPKKFVKKRGAKGTSMAFKLRKADQRAHVIAYLKTLK